MTPSERADTVEQIDPEDRPTSGGVENRLIEFIRDEIVLGDEIVLADTDLLLTGAVDSLGVIRITQWMEDELGLVVEPGDVTLENFQTVANMVAYVSANPTDHS